MFLYVRQVWLHILRSTFECIETMACFAFKLEEARSRLSIFKIIYRFEFVTLFLDSILKFILLRDYHNSRYLSQFNVLWWITDYFDGPFV